MALSACGSRIFRTTNRTLGQCLPSILGEFGLGSVTGSKRKIGPLHLHRGIRVPCDWRRNYGDCMKSPPCLRDELICNVVDAVQDGFNKVTIVGAGMVGVACANSILFQKISSHIALIDAFPKKLKGEGLDYSHGLAFLGDPRIEYDTDFCISTNSKVVVICTGARETKNEDKMAMVQRNAEIVKTIILPLVEYSPKAIFLIVSNPVDIMSWLAWKVSGLPINRVIGTGTHVDSARFRQVIAERLGIASKSVHAYMIGEHGDTEVPLWSGVSVAGVLFRDILPNIGLTTDEEKWYEVIKHVLQGEGSVKCLKGYSNTAIGLAVADIVQAILRNNQTVKTVSTLAQGHYNICHEVFLSLPCSIGENGIGNVVRLRMTEMEMKQLQTCADTVFNVQKHLKP